MGIKSTQAFIFQIEYQDSTISHVLFCFVFSGVTLESVLPLCLMLFFSGDDQNTMFMCYSPYNAGGKTRASHMWIIYSAHWAISLTLLTLRFSLINSKIKLTIKKWDSMLLFLFYCLSVRVWEKSTVEEK